VPNERLIDRDEGVAADPILVQKVVTQ